MFCESCTERGDSSVQEAGEDGCGSGQVTFQESCRLMVQANSNPHDKLLGVSVCLCVCRSAYRYRFAFFLGGRGGGWGAEKHMIVRETGQIATTGACGGRRLRTDLQYIS